MPNTGLDDKWLLWLFVGCIALGVIIGTAFEKRDFIIKFLRNAFGRMLGKFTDA